MYNVGDVVRIKTDLKKADSTGVGLNDYMLALSGRLAIIERKSNQLFTDQVIYTLNVDGGEWDWVEGMLENISPNKTEKVVFCKFRHGDKPYLYKIPRGVNVEIGEEVFVETKFGETHCTVTSESFEASEDTIKGIIGSDASLKSVTGMAIKEKYVKKEF